MLAATFADIIQKINHNFSEKHLFPDRKFFLTKLPMKLNFNIEILPEAIKFLETLQNKTTEKIY